MDAAAQALGDRRAGVRLARGTRVDVVILDEASQPLATIGDAQVVDVSAHGLALMTSTRVKPGTLLQVRPGAKGQDGEADSFCRVRVLSCLMHEGNTQTLHCELSEGLMPAALIYNWAA